MFSGSITALITPFRGGKVDEKAFAALVDWQIREGTSALVPCGTTGESPTLSPAEHQRVIEICVEAAGGRVPVIAGTGSNSTQEAVVLTHHARKAGADAALIVTPYYNKPTQEGLFAHFRAIAEAVDLPILIYNIPSRSVIDMSVETMARLARMPNIVGVKDATGDIGRISRQRAALGPAFCQLSGDDALALGQIAHGATGCISVTANVAPRLLAEFEAACLKGDLAQARERHDRLLPLHEALFAETSPAPVKYAASLLGLCEEELRLPLVPVGEATRARISRALTGLGLLATA